MNMYEFLYTLNDYDVVDEIDIAAETVLEASIHLCNTILKCCEGSGANVINWRLVDIRPIVDGLTITHLRPG
jgi:hypothetical protein